jgi:alpha-L-fucosidase
VELFILVVVKKRISNSLDEIIEDIKRWVELVENYSPDIIIKKILNT